MSGVKHTPGPWVWTGKYEVGPISREDDQTNGMVIPLADVFGGNREANARLIASAPEMFEALEVLVAHTDGLALPTTAQAARLKALAALSKATAQQEGR